MTATSFTALGGCINVLDHSFAPQFEVESNDLHVQIEGDLNPDDFRGIDPSVKVGFEEIRYNVQITLPSPQEKNDALLFCPVKGSSLGTNMIRNT